MKAIIISGMPASGKTTVAGILSRRLNRRTVGIGDVLKEIAGERGYKISGEGWWETPEGMRFHKERDSNPEFDKEADKRLISLVKKGDVIVTSYTAPWIADEGFKIWLSAEESNRAERMAKRDNTDLGKADKATRMRDREDHDLYKSLYNFELGKDLKPFDLVVDTNDITADEVAERILKKLKELNIG